MNNTRVFLNKNNILKIGSIFIVVMLLLSCITIQEKSGKVKTVGAFTLITEAIQDIDYSYSNNVLTINTDKPITITNTNTTTDSIFVDGNYDTNITLDGVTIDVSSKSKGALVIEDNNPKNVTITLAENSKNTIKSGGVYAGIQKNGDTTSGKLLIRCASDEGYGHNCTEDCGELYVRANNDGAGIGGAGNNQESGQDGCNIVINGGNLNCSSNYDGAGIGGGENGDGNNIVINGGIITSTGGSSASGIGGGRDGGDGINITINGGVVNAQGGQDGAGIGGGCINYGDDDGGEGRNIIIKGGKVEAKGGGSATGIGGGTRGQGYNILIEDGEVIAIGSSGGAGIGGGTQGKGIKITITGGTVTATGGSNAGAGIGGGNSGGAGREIIISGGIVNATGGVNGAGIGGGYSGADNSITINGGTVTAQGGGYASGIGEGSCGMNSQITINGGSITATGGKNGAGIGGGYLGGENNVIINGGEVKATGGDDTDNPEKGMVAIGKGGYTNKESTVTVKSKLIEATDIDRNVVSTTNLNVANLTSYNYVKLFVPFHIEGGTINSDYAYDATFDVLTINTATQLKISNTIKEQATTARIVVASSAGANITFSGLNINTSEIWRGAAFAIDNNATGTVTITLAEGSKNSFLSGFNAAGLQKNDTDASVTGRKLIIKCMNGDVTHQCSEECGTLTTTGGDSGAGIGNGEYEKCGNDIEIQGGVIIATGGEHGAGIGGGYNGDASDITISGGIVTAIGGDYAPGIGGAYDGDASDITISGGKVTSTGGEWASGIGGAYSGYASDIEISGGIVNAIAGEDGTGIGSGESGEIGNITISGGDVTVQASGLTAAIGGAYRVSGGNISITGGIVTAGSSTADRCMGIGAGFNCSTNNTIVKITGGTVIAKGTSKAINALSENITLTNVDIIKASTYVTGENADLSPSKEEISNYLYMEIKEYTGDFEVSGAGYSFDDTNRILNIIDGAEVIIKNKNISTATTDRIVVASGADANITLAGVYIDKRNNSNAAPFMIADGSTGNVKIVLANNSENTLKAGLNYAALQKNGDISSGKLFITCESDEGNGHECTDMCGKLNATSNEQGAGIGGGGIYDKSNQHGSNITINGGNINATGKSSAGIGGGYNGSGINIIINGGIVNSSSIYGGAGIGGGYSGMDSGNDCGNGNNITINGGIVEATGGTSGAGIGGGEYGNGSNITINGGTVEATGGTSGAGIGGGKNGKGSIITITGGHITATAENLSSSGGAGIGGGINGEGSDIEISGGVVIAQGAAQGAGIGGGDSSIGRNIKISGGEVTAKGGRYAAGVGSSYMKHAQGIEISGGIVIAGSDSTDRNVGLGAGYETYDLSTTTVKITGGSVIAKGTQKAINALPENITLKNMEITKACTDVEGVNDASSLDKENIENYLYVKIGIYTGDFEVEGICYSFDITNRILNIEDGAEVIIKNKNISTATTDRIVVASGADANITLAGVNIATTTGAAFEIAANSNGFSEGNVTLILEHGKTNTLKSGMDYAGLQKNGEPLSDTQGKLVIKCNGTCDSNCTAELNVTGGYYGAGIGGGYNGKGMNIKISGGKVTATGGKYGGAGIGGGAYANASGIEIIGGEVTAIGGYNRGSGGAGIGGGSGSAGNNIKIRGGVVRTTGGYNAAGIGGGDYGSASSIEIIGGEVTAEGKDNGAGIGGGDSGLGSDIKIRGGVVRATGGSNGGAGIGGGAYGSASSIEIMGGEVTAEGGKNSAGIGGGDYGKGNDIKILGGTIETYAQEINGYGIGSGYGFNGDLGDISIVAGDVTAKGMTSAINGKLIYDTNFVYAKEASENYDKTNIITSPDMDATSLSTYKYINMVGIGKVVGPFVVVGGELDEHYTYEENSKIFTVINGANDLKIKNVDSSTPTDTGIKVAPNINANITLAGVNINVNVDSSMDYNRAAFEIAENSTGNVKIILANKTQNTLTSGNNGAAIQKNGGTTTGNLLVTCDSDAGSGHTCNNDCGQIMLNPGYNGAGIGGGRSAEGSNITISGGKVNVTSGNYGAGIGGGYEGAGNKITINGGEIIITEGGEGAGIGGGYKGNGDTININKGIVTVQKSSSGYNSGAGIGGGRNGSGSNITISGGEVNVYGRDYAAGIGGGQQGAGSTITITGGNVTATGGLQAAGIGGGYKGEGSNITISGGKVIATGGEKGAGIGGGSEADANVITIEGGDVKAVGGYNGAGIGGGYFKTGNDITIRGGKVSTRGGKCAVEGATISLDILEASTQYKTEDYTQGQLEPSPLIENITSYKYVKLIALPFVIVGGKLGDDYEYDESYTVLTVKTDTALTISNKKTEATTARIVVAKDVAANITLAGVNIDVSEIAGTAAFKIEDNSTGNVTITLANEKTNILKSGQYCAGLQKNGDYISEDKGRLTITCTSEENGHTCSDICGRLEAYGKDYGAGIGGGMNGDGSNITISGGIVIAHGSDSAAGIGGGRIGTGEHIIINGGNITAQGYLSGSGIGGGYHGDGIDIQIHGGIVNATGKWQAAGIGGGNVGSGRDIYITGGVVNAIAKYKGAGIGGGDNGSSNVNSIRITGGVVNAYGQDYGVGAQATGIGGSGESSNNTIIIEGGTVTAHGGSNGVGIGAGIDATGGKIEIHNPNSVIAKGGFKAINGTLDLSKGSLDIIEASILYKTNDYKLSDFVDFPKDDDESLSIYNYIMIGTKTINVTITWGNLDYEYKAGPWQTDSLEYAQGEFVPTVTNGGDKITVQNDSNVNIVATITCTIDSPYEYIHTSILETKPSGTDIKGQPKTVYKSNFVDMYLVLTGKLPVGVMKQKVGHVTVALDN